MYGCNDDPEEADTIQKHDEIKSKSNENANAEKRWKPCIVTIPNKNGKRTNELQQNELY